MLVWSCRSRTGPGALHFSPIAPCECGFPPIHTPRSVFYVAIPRKKSSSSHSSRYAYASSAICALAQVCSRLHSSVSSLSSCAISPFAASVLLVTRKHERLILMSTPDCSYNFVRRHAQLQWSLMLVFLLIIGSWWSLQRRGVL